MHQGLKIRKTGGPILVVRMALVFMSFWNFNQVEVQAQAKPYVYWWWMGNRVDSAGLAMNLDSFQSAGFGGVHIIPINEKNSCF